VLVVGSEPVALAAWLAELSFDVVAACDDPSVVLAGRREYAQIDFLRLTPGPRCVLPGHLFDAAFLQPLSGHGTDWLSSSSRLLTAAVLAALKPNARLMTWSRASAGGHQPMCWTHHFACFPGRIESRDSVHSRFAWIRRGNNPAGLRLITWQSPTESLTMNEWRNYATRGLLTGRRSCCGFAQSSEQSVAERRAA